MATILELAQKMMLGEVPPAPISRLLGFVIKAIEPGHAIFEMEVDDRHHNPSSLFGQFGNDQISPTAAILDKKLEALVAAAFK